MFWVILAATGAPLWAAAGFLSLLSYAGLPAHPPGCFVVTAASRGHRRVVGSLVPIFRNGAPCLANSQLLVFWRLEAVWMWRAPRSHRAFRRFYNIWGRRLARRIRRPLAADAVYLLLKPLEWLARLVLTGSRAATTPAIAAAFACEEVCP